MGKFAGFSADQRLIYSAAFLRAAGIGLLGVLFAINLSVNGLDAARIGLLVAAGLAGAVTGTLFVTFCADRFGHRNTLLLLSSLTAAGAFGLASFRSFPWLAAACFLGMVNAMGRERGALFTLEQRILPHAATGHERTRALAWYNVLLDLGQAAGSLLAFAARGQAFALYAAIACLNLLLYLCLSPAVESGTVSERRKLSPGSRKIVTRLSLLFGFDSLAGGFLPGSLIAFWFFKRFGLGEQWLGPLFFLAHLANAVSYLAAARLAKKIGLVRTMVFTHLPSNLCLIAIPFVPSAALAAFLYLVRESLVEMDVPTRQSYVLAVVEPHERTMAAGVTNLVRLAAWTVAPTLAGLAMGALALGSPLVVGGGMKVLYDGMLFLSFRHVRPPEEA